VEFHLEEYIKGRDFAAEVERIYGLGRLTPQQWMTEATGEKISVQPLLTAVREYLDKPGAYSGVPKAGSYSK